MKTDSGHDRDGERAGSSSVDADKLKEVAASGQARRGRASQLGEVESSDGDQKVGEKGMEACVMERCARNPESPTDDELSKIGIDVPGDERRFEDIGRVHEGVAVIRGFDDTVVGDEAQRGCESRLQEVAAGRKAQRGYMTKVKEVT
jgi:hypothetical protein